MSAAIPMIGRMVRAGQEALRLARYIASKAITLTCDLGFGEMPLDRSQLKMVAGFLRAHHGTSRASEVRHVIFSAPPGTPPEIARPIIQQVARDWIATHAPGRRWMLGLQDHNLKEHGHLEVEGVGADGEPLKFGLREAISTSGMEFTSCAVSAKGKGLGKSVPVYPKAKSLAVRDLATALLDDRGGMRADLWADYVRAGTVSDLRNRKDGTLISFAFGGRRMRLSTLRGFLQQQHLNSKGGDKNGTIRLQKQQERQLRRSGNRHGDLASRARGR